MTDKEEVIKGLEEVQHYIKVENLPAHTLKAKLIIDDAIALLKAQEPVKPTLDIRHGKSMWRCGSCSTALQPNQMHAKFCFNCGQAVKW